MMCIKTNYTLLVWSYWQVQYPDITYIYIIIKATDYYKKIILKNNYYYYTNISQTWYEMSLCVENKFVTWERMLRRKDAIHYLSKWNRRLKYTNLDLMSQNFKKSYHKYIDLISQGNR
jgi:hypothetical protein